VESRYCDKRTTSWSRQVRQWRHMATTSRCFSQPCTSSPLYRETSRQSTSAGASCSLEGCTPSGSKAHNLSSSNHLSGDAYRFSKQFACKAKAGSSKWKSFACVASSDGADEVTLLDYGAGNVRSVRNAIKLLGYKVRDVEKPGMSLLGTLQNGWFYHHACSGI
jgi:hypothetical protein